MTGNTGLVHTAPAGPQLFSPSPIAHCPSPQGDNSHGPQRSSEPPASSGASQSLPLSHPQHIHFLGKWQFQVIHIVALVLKASSCFVSRCMGSGEASRCTFIIAWGRKLLRRVSHWVAGWEDRMALRLIFTKNKHRVRRNEKQGTGSKGNVGSKLEQAEHVRLSNGRSWAPP